MRNRTTAAENETRLPVSLEDVEDLYLFGLMITGFLLFGVSRYLADRQIRKTLAAVDPGAHQLDGINLGKVASYVTFDLFQLLFFICHFEFNRNGAHFGEFTVFERKLDRLVKIHFQS